MSERILTKKDLSKVLNRYVWARQSPFNYETMQSGGWVWAIHPAMAKIYDNDKEVLSAKYRQHFRFYNTHPWMGNIILGACLAIEETKEPLYFRFYNNTISNVYTSGEPQTTTLMPTDALYNEKLYNYIKGIIEEFGFTYPTVLESEGKVQLFFVKGEGGYEEKEKTIKKGLEDVAKILGKLEGKDEITWAQVLDVSIDNIGNVYNFLVTCNIETTNFQMTVDDYKKLQKKFEKIEKNESK